MTNTTFALVATYQFSENYGAHAWDGKGECPQHWKQKGIEEVTVVEGLTTQGVMDLGTEGLQNLVNERTPESDDYVDYMSAGWELVELGDALIETVRAYLLDSDQDGQFGHDLDYARFSYEQDIGPEYGFDWAVKQLEAAGVLELDTNTGGYARKFKLVA